jgi:hypothetical protein
MGSTLATMITMTTYGTWLRGDKRGWVEDGKVLPAEPEIEEGDRSRMRFPPYRLPRERLHECGQHMGAALTSRLSVELLALSVGTWHVHLVIGPTRHPIGAIVKCAKDAARYGLRPGRPMWTAGYDKRFCFDERSLRARIRYVERHNKSLGWPAAPWAFLSDVNQLLNS